MSNHDDLYCLQTGSISVFSIPGGAKIYLDGIEQSNSTPTIITDITPGMHTYRLTYPGYIDIEGMSNIIEGKTYELFLTMEESFNVRQAFIYGFLASIIAGTTLYILTRRTIQ